MLTSPQGNEGWGGGCRGERVVAGEVLGLSQCLDSAAGGDAVKLVNPVETGISPAGGRPPRRGGGWGGCRSLSLRTVPCCGGTPHLNAAPPSKNPPRAPSDPIR